MLANCTVVLQVELDDDAIGNQRFDRLVASEIEGSGFVTVVSFIVLKEPEEPHDGFGSYCDEMDELDRLKRHEEDEAE